MLLARGAQDGKLSARPLPPPPVPPRPSKALVAEALARTRRGNAVPTRKAPPPPIPLVRTLLPGTATQQVDCNQPRRNIGKPTESSNGNVGARKLDSPLVVSNYLLKCDGQVPVAAEKETRSDKTLSEEANTSSQNNSVDVITQSKQHAISLAKSFEELETEKRPHCVPLAQGAPNPRPSLSESHPPNNRPEGLKLSSEQTLSSNHVYEEVKRVSEHPHCLPNGHDVAQQQALSEALASQQNRDAKQPKVRRQPYVPVLPTGQHKHDKSPPSLPPTADNNRNTVLLIDNHKKSPSEDASMQGSPLVEDLVEELRESARQREDLSGSNTRIQHSDWFKLEDNGQQVLYSSCQITLEDIPDQQQECSVYYNHCYELTNLSVDPVDYRRQQRRAMASLQGLPPLPKSLSGLNLFESGGGGGAATSSNSYRPVSVPTASSRAGSSLMHHSHPHLRNLPPAPNGLGEAPPPPLAPRARKLTGLDQQLAILRKEMFGLRQLDLSLLSQLWSLNESIQEFRQLLADQEDSAPLSPPSPSSADEAEEFYSPLPRYHAVQLTAVPEQYRLSSSSSQSSIEYGDV